MTDPLRLLRPANDPQAELAMPVRALDQGSVCPVRSGSPGPLCAGRSALDFRAGGGNLLSVGIKHILLAVDSDSSDDAVVVGGRLARRLHARLTVAHFGPNDAVGRAAVSRATHSLDRSGVTADVRLEQLTAGYTVAQSLLTMAEALKPDLLVLGSRGRSAPAVSLFGSVSREVARTAHLPVLIAREGVRQAGPAAHLLLVVTEETLGSSELEVGIELARGLSASVTVLHVHGPLEEAVADLMKVPTSRRLDHLTNDLLARLRSAGIEANIVIARNRDGLASEVSRAALSTDSDLVVIPAGTTDAAERWLLGTVEEEMGRRSQLSVVVTPPSGTSRTGPGGC
jgi:nucleotide-binding universal stress UspA family protein